jgi:hypothetical protein
MIFANETVTKNDKLMIRRFIHKITNKSSTMWGNKKPRYCGALV